MTSGLVERLIYPVTLAAGSFCAYYLLYVKNAHLLIIAVPLSLAFLVCFIAERRLPFRQQWQKTHDNDVVTDSSYIVLNVAVRELLTPIFKVLIASLLLSAGSLAIAGELWPTQWHPLWQLLLAVLFLDFFQYWFHRLSHRYALLWRFHAVHHSPKRLYFFNAARFHIVDWIVLIVIESALLVLIGADAKIIALTAVFVQIHGLFQHANIRQKNGWLNYLFSAAELHRWHHSINVQESDSNFGNNVIVWDLLFGTFYLPKAREVGEIGLLNPDYPQTYWRQLLAPFYKRRIDQPD